MSLERLFVRYCFLAMTLAANVTSFPAMAQAQAANYNFDLPAQSLASALDAFGRTCNQQLVFDEALVRDKRSNALVGKYSVDEAIRLILNGSGLTYTRTAKGVLAIQALEDPHKSDNWHSTEETTPLSEIVVTAQKKEEQLQYVPVPVTVVNTGALAENGQSRLQDFFATVPGLSLNASSTGFGGAQSIAIRGISSGADTNPTVGITIDDVPYGASTVLAFGGGLYPDIDPSDLSRIEVLRGPQGTLYGASSLAGC